MSSAVMTKNVLMIGKSNKVMARMARRMERDGLKVSFTDDVQHAGQDYDGRNFGAIVVGRKLVGSDSDEIKRTLLAQNPRLPIVTSLGPYGELVAQQALAALYAASDDPPLLNDVAYVDGSLRFSVSRGCPVRVTLYRRTVIYQLRSNVIYSSCLPAGQHAVPISRRQLGIGGETFAVVTAADRQRELVRLR